MLKFPSYMCFFYFLYFKKTKCKIGHGTMLNFEMKLSSEIMVDGHPSTISPQVWLHLLLRFLVKTFKCLGLAWFGLWCLTPLSKIFQLYSGS